MIEITPVNDQRILQYTEEDLQKKKLPELKQICNNHNISKGKL